MNQRIIIVSLTIFLLNLFCANYFRASEPKYVTLTEEPKFIIMFNGNVSDFENDHLEYDTQLQVEFLMKNTPFTGRFRPYKTDLFVLEQTLYQDNELHGKAFTSDALNLAKEEAEKHFKSNEIQKLKKMIDLDKVNDISIAFAHKDVLTLYFVKIQPVYGTYTNVAEYVIKLAMNSE